MTKERQGMGDGGRSTSATRIGLGIATGGLSELPGLVGGGSDSTLTIKQDPAAADAIAQKKADQAAAAPMPPMLGDEEQRKARAAQMMRLLSGRGRASSFLTAPR